MATAEEQQAAEAAAQAAAEAKAAADAKAQADAAAAAEAEKAKAHPDDGSSGKTEAELQAEKEAAAAAAAKATENKRYSELTRAQKQAERERDDANKRLSQALEAVERLTGSSAAAAKKQAAEEDPEPQLPEFSDPEQYQREMAQYAKSTAERASRIAVKAAMAEEQTKRVQETQQQTASRIRAEFKQREDEARTAYEDYDAVVRADDLSLSESVVGAAAVDPEGAHLLYYLGSNRQEAERIYALPPGVQLMELGALKVRLLAERAAKKVTRAPAPFKPTGGAGSVSRPVDQLSMDEYAAKRLPELQAARKPGVR